MEKIYSVFRPYSDIPSFSSPPSAEWPPHARLTFSFWTVGRANVADWPYSGPVVGKIEPRSDDIFAAVNMQQASPEKRSAGPDMGAGRCGQLMKGAFFLCIGTSLWHSTL
jgi:hypothetical protein